MSLIHASNIFRYPITGRISGKNKFRYGTSLLFSSNKFRYGVAAKVSSINKFRYGSMSMAAWNLAADDPEPYYAVGIQAWIVLNGAINNYLQGSGNFYVKSFSIHQTKNRILSWEMEILDKSGTLSPHATGVWANILNTSPFNSQGNVNKTLSVEVQVQDKTGTSNFTYTYSGLVIRSRTFEATSKGYTFKISGTDTIGLLLGQRNVTLSSYISKTGQISMASTVLKDLFNYLKITSYVLNFDDYPVRQFHVQNEKGIDVLNKILWVPDATWYSNGNTIFVEQPSISPTTSDFTYTGNTNVFIIQEQETAPSDFMNEVTVTIPEISVISAATVTGNSYGRYEANFKPPVTARPSWRFISNQGGDITEMDCFGPNEEPVGHFEFTPQTALGSGLNVASPNMPVPIINNVQPGASIAIIRFNYAPPLNPSLTPTQSFLGYVEHPHFEVFFYGRSAIRPDLMPYIPAGLGSFQIPAGFISAQINYGNIINVALQYAITLQSNPSATTVVGNPTVPSLADLSQYLKLGVTVTDATSVAANGPWPSSKPISSMIIPNTAWAYRVGIQQLIESSRNKNVVTVTAPYNPFVRVGTNLSLTESVSNITGIYQVEEWDFSIENRGQVRSVFKTSKYSVGS